MLLDEERNRHIIDGLRGIGILLVVFFHTVFAAIIGVAKNKMLPESDQIAAVDRFVDEFPWIFNIVWQALGSEMIFFLSGFLLSYLLFRELLQKGSIRIRDFLIKRASRILPLYAIALFLYAFGARKLGVMDCVWNLLFISKIVDARMIIPVGWSLEVLVQFYLIVPFLVLLVMKTRWPFLVMGALLVASLASRYAFLLSHPEGYETPIWLLLYGAKANDAQNDLYHLLWFRAAPFIMGLWIAYLVVHRADRLRALFGPYRRNVAFFGLGALFIVASGFLPLQDKNAFVYKLDQNFWISFHTLQRFVFVVGLSLVMLASIHSSKGIVATVTRFFVWKHFTVVSKSIYSIYLFHFAFVLVGAALVSWSVDRYSVRSIPTFDVVAIFLVASWLSVLFARVVTKYVELPAQGWIRRRFLSS